MKILSQARGIGMPSELLENIYERHANMLYKLCMSYMKNPAEAEDAVADVFVKLLEKSVEFKNSEHEKAWLLRTAVNLCKDRLKHWWRRREDIDDYSHLASGKDYFSEDDTLRAVLDLPVRLKADVYLHYYEGYTTAEIAKLLNKPQSTVLSHLREARIILREALKLEE